MGGKLVRMPIVQLASYMKIQIMKQLLRLDKQKHPLSRLDHVSFMLEIEILIEMPCPAPVFNTKMTSPGFVRGRFLKSDLTFL